MAHDVAINKAPSSSAVSLACAKNVALHVYRRLDLQIVKSIVTRNLDDFLEFSAIILKLKPGATP